jgi:hypothetical protein
MRCADNPLATKALLRNPSVPCSRHCCVFRIVERLSFVAELD